MAGSRNVELTRRLDRLVFLSRLRTVAAWSAVVMGFTSLIFLVDPDLRALLRNDRLGPPIEIPGIVVGVYVPDSGNSPYRPPVPIVELENGRQLRIRNPRRISFLKGDRLIVQVRTYEKSDGKRYLILRRTSDDG